MNIRSLVAAMLATMTLAAPSLAQPGPSLVPPKPLAKAASAPTPAPQTNTPRPLTRDDLEAWLDGYMPYALARGNVAGGVVAVVKDGQVLLEKGYGYADVAKRTPINPETTLFRPGSVSKLFTWTAVMQLVEQGKLNLDADVETYLDFKLPPYHGQPVTLRDLMTHTGGFEESVKNLIVTDPKDVPPLGRFLKAQIPARIFPPGQVPAYSNYGAALAGYIVQRVSGQSFDSYIEQHIFAPLDMRHATFRQPLPQALRPLMAQGYEVATGPAKPYELIGLAPAGSSAISAGDMTHFMIAHLQDGAYQGQRILQPATARMMHDTPLTIIPHLHRMLLGFYETDRNGHRIIGHGGDLQWFHSDLELFLDDHVGLFVSLNSVGRDGAAGPIREALFEQFADRYFPGPAAQGHVDPAQAKADAALVSGDYEVSRRMQTNFLSLMNLLGQAKVSTDKDGYLVASPVMGLNGQPKRFEPIGRYVWRDVDGKDRLAAKVVDGKVSMWAEDEWSPFMVYTPVPGAHNAAWLLPAVIGAIAVMLLTAALWPLAVLARRRYGAAFTLQGRSAASYRAVRVAAAASGLLMATWFAVVLTMVQTFTLGSSMDAPILILHLLSILVFPLAALAGVVNAWVVCTSRSGLRAAFAWGWSVLIALSALVLLWTALVFHLIGLGLTY